MRLLGERERSRAADEQWRPPQRCRRTLGRLTGSAISARSVGESLKEQQTSNGILDRRLQNIEAAMSTINERRGECRQRPDRRQRRQELPGHGPAGQAGLAQMAAALKHLGCRQLSLRRHPDRGPADQDARDDERDLRRRRPFRQVRGGLQRGGGAAPRRLGHAVGRQSRDRRRHDELSERRVHRPRDRRDLQIFRALPRQTRNYLGATNTIVNDAYANWTANWSNASADTGQSRISSTETVTSLASANDDAYRDMISAIPCSPISASPRSATTRVRSS